jgi:hypothetical protein
MEGHRAVTGKLQIGDFGSGFCAAIWIFVRWRGLRLCRNNREQRCTKRKPAIRTEFSPVKLE